MLIVCPSCASRYSIDDEKIGPDGKTVRCASCRTDFFASAPAPSSDGFAASLAPLPSSTRPLAAELASALIEPASDEDLAREWLEAEKSSDASRGTAASRVEAPRDLDQGEMDALFSQEMAAAQQDAEALETAGLTPDEGKAPAGWRRFLPAWPQKRTEDAPAPAASMSSDGSFALPGKKRMPGAGGKAGSMPSRRARSAVALPARMLAPLKGPIGLGLGGALLIVVAIHQREQVVRLAPSTAGLFSLAGLAVNLQGLVFADVRSTLVSDGPVRFLVVDGVVRNVRAGQVAVPLIEISIRGDDRRTVYSWTTEPPRANLKPGEALQFRARLATPPEAGRDIKVSFADRPGKALAQR